MDSVNVDTRESLADLIARVEAGETVVITREGTPVARIEHVPPPKKLKPIDFKALAEFRASLPYQEESAGDFMRRLRDEARY